MLGLVRSACGRSYDHAKTISDVDPEGALLELLEFSQRA